MISRGVVCTLSLALAAGLTLSMGRATLQPPAERPPTSPEPGRERPEGRPGLQPGQRPEPRNVEGAMKLINRSLRQVNALIGEPGKKADVLRLIGDAQRGAVIAKGMEPDATPQEGREKYLADFRAAQITLLRTLLDLETHVLNDRVAEARTVMNDLAKYRDASHKTFEVKDDGDGKGWARPPEPR